MVTEGVRKGPRILALTVLAALSVLTNCSPVAPLETHGSATDGLPVLTDPTLRVESNALTYLLKRQSDGYYRIEEVTGEDNGQLKTARRGDSDWAEGFADKTGIFSADRIRIYTVDAKQFGLEDDAGRIVKHADEFRGELQGLIQRQNKRAQSYLSFAEKDPARPQSLQFLLFAMEFNEKAWDADSGRTAEALEVKAFPGGILVPHIPYARWSVLMPRGIALRGMDVIMSGANTSENSKVPPLASRCEKLGDAPQWVTSACISNFAKHEDDNGAHWQRDFSGLVAGDPNKLRAAIRQLAAGLSKPVAPPKDPQESMKPDYDPAPYGLFRVI